MLLELQGGACAVEHCSVVKVGGPTSLGNPLVQRSSRQPWRRHFPNYQNLGVEIWCNFDSQLNDYVPVPQKHFLFIYFRLVGLQLLHSGRRWQKRQFISIIFQTSCSICNFPFFVFSNFSAHFSFWGPRVVLKDWFLQPSGVAGSFVILAAAVLLLLSYLYLNLWSISYPI